MKVTAVVGARPNFVKIAAIMAETGKYPDLECRLIHTGQHYDAAMSERFFRELEIPAPDVNLGVGPGSSAAQTGEVMVRLADALTRERPDLVLVVGDVNSTVAAALVAVKMGIPVAHVEAGLRSFDRSMPEEINRIVTDAVSDYCFTTEPAAGENLLREGVPASRIFHVGNVMIDTLLRFRDRAASSAALERLGVARGGYAVLTLHRPSNVDDASALQRLLEALLPIQRDVPVIFPVHPRTRQRLVELPAAVAAGLRLTEPLGYLDFLQLMDNAAAVLTDSGGIQEETTALGVPCLTLRTTTERPITVTEGTNRIVGVDPAAILGAWREIRAGAWPEGRVPELWDGKAAERIVKVLLGAAP
ncbi:MAG TPA: UDP-N-acetylglucosamine 2-epimerase (non-hydrolyzing) [Candidatus Tectomicrobia bacterium]|nr:UDP-N-acetylglucosamine 2-epimerase (non-hydrolyzing) [Candidatus Tectomicrobia bacterium]